MKKRILRIDGTLPIPSEAHKCIENPFLSVSISNGIKNMPLQVAAYASVEDLLAETNCISVYNNLSAPYLLIVGKKDNETLFFDEIEQHNSMVDKNIVEKVYGIIGNQKIDVKVGETEIYKISIVDYIDKDNEGKNVVDKMALFACQILKQKIEQNYSERVADGRIKNIEILEI